MGRDWGQQDGTYCAQSDNNPGVDHRGGGVKAASRQDCWVITDASAGNQRQALALAEYVGMPFQHLLLQPRAPWSWLSPRLVFASEHALVPAQRSQFAEPWPALAIGCGRSAALFTRMLRPLAEGRCHTVQILDPRIDLAHWDTVIAPRHDQLHGPNVLTPLGSLNAIDAMWLDAGRESCPSFADLPRPRVGILLGGPRRQLAIDRGYATQLAQRVLQRWRNEGGSLMLLASRRTPAEVMQIMQDTLHEAIAVTWAGPDSGRNPYPGVLAWADRLIVTPDSVNMLSEACAVGCPVHTMTLAPLPARLARFHQSLRDAGLLHELDDHPPSQQPPLRETADIAATLRKRMR